MKMVKGLLLGTAAGLVAVAGAHAADLPVKAAPVQYVKICSLYGDGFYYIPGTDICLKVGGYVRGEYFYNYGANGTNGPFQAGAAGASNPAGNGAGYRDRSDGGDFINNWVILVCLAPAPGYCSVHREQPAICADHPTAPECHR